MNKIVEALRAGTQADADGVFVRVSRQACEEAANLLILLAEDLQAARAALAEHDAQPHLEQTALARFEECNGHKEPNPLERLRFFCSLAMNGQDWLDVEPFFDELAQPQQEPGQADEKIAEILWHHFGADHVERWEDEPHKAEFKAAARAVTTAQPSLAQPQQERIPLFGAVIDSLPGMADELKAAWAQPAPAAPQERERFEAWRDTQGEHGRWWHHVDPDAAAWASWQAAVKP